MTRRGTRGPSSATRGSPPASSPRPRRVRRSRRVGWPRTEAAVTSVAAAAATSSGTPRSASAAADAAGADAPAPALAGRAALVGVPAGVPSRVRLVGVLAALPPAPPPLVLRSDGPACGRCASRPSAEGGCLVGLRASASCGAFAALQAVRGAAAFWKGAGAGALTPRAPRAWPGAESQACRSTARFRVRAAGVVGDLRMARQFEYRSYVSWQPVALPETAHLMAAHRRGAPGACLVLVRRPARAGRRRARGALRRPRRRGRAGGHQERVQAAAALPGQRLQHLRARIGFLSR